MPVTSPLPREMLEAILGAIDEGIHVVDARGITVFYNRVAAALDGLDPEEVLGRHVLEVFPSLDPGSSTLLTVIATGRPIVDRRQTYTNVRGQTVHTVNTTLPVFVDGQLVGAVEVAKDITRIKELSEQLVDLQARVARRRMRRQDDSAAAYGARYRFSDLITQDAAMERVKALAQRAARTDSPIFVYGETGTGKELLVQAIHNASPRAAGPFVAQNCAALPATLLEGLLFGTVRGSFTGAEDRPGLFELADGGTLFLDEVQAMPLELQAKLLRVLQDGVIRRIGSTRTRVVDVRVIAATNVEPRQAVEQGLLRADLYYRLNVVALTLPPLRERRGDIPLLVAHFLAKCNARFGTRIKGLREQVWPILMRYAWPGNVRELEHVIEGAVNIVEGEWIGVEHLPPHLVAAAERGEPAPRGIAVAAGGEGAPVTVDVRVPGDGEPKRLPLRETLAAVERRLIAEALAATGGNLQQAAKLLGLPRQTLQYRLAKWEGVNVRQKGETGR